jgi:hypothetical protein
VPKLHVVVGTLATSIADRPDTRATGPAKRKVSIASVQSRADQSDLVNCSRWANAPLCHKL